MAKVAKGMPIASSGGTYKMDIEVTQECCDSRWGSSTRMAPSESGMACGESAVLDLLDSGAGNDARTLRAVLRVGHAVLGAQHFNDALEVIADQTLTALDAASFSISRWDRQRGVLRTLINVGELGPGEERWP